MCLITLQLLHYYEYIIIRLDIPRKSIKPNIIQLGFFFSFRNEILVLIDIYAILIVIFQSAKCLTIRLTWCIVDSKHLYYPCIGQYFVGSPVCSLNDVSAIAISAAEVIPMSHELFPRCNIRHIDE